MKNLTKILCALLIVLTISCAKDGATGPAGTNGTNGTNGTDGNANVIYSAWNNCTQTNVFDRDGYHHKRYSFTGDQNSSDSTSAILKFMRIIFTSGTVTTGYQIPFEYGLIRYSSWYSSEFIARMPNSTSDAGINRYQVRTVLIKGTTGLRLAKPLTQMTYDEVCELYNIPK